MHQPRRIAARGQHLGHDVFLADVGLGNVFDRRALLGGQRLRVDAQTFAQRQRKLRVVEDSDTARVQKARHAIGEACARRCAGDDDAVIAGLVDGFTNAQLVGRVATLLDAPYTTRQATYDLRRLKRKGLIRTLHGAHRYELTSVGRTVAVLFTKSATPAF
jgi:hypothetical protein